MSFSRHVSLVHEPHFINNHLETFPVDDYLSYSYDLCVRLYTVVLFILYRERRKKNKDGSVVRMNV